MSDMTQITDYSAILELLAEQYKTSEKMRGILDAMCISADDLEDALFEIRSQFWIDTAEGAQLDILGAVFGLERTAGLADADYREQLEFKLANLFASGTPEDIINTIIGLYGGTFVDYSRDGLTASFNIITDATITQTQLDSISPAGVGSHLLCPLLDGAGDIIVDGAGDPIYAHCPDGILVGLALDSSDDEDVLLLDSSGDRLLIRVGV
jgi:hypothetical protein